MSGHNRENKEKIIKLVEKSTSSMDTWPDWKKNISLSETSTSGDKISTDNSNDTER